MLRALTLALTVALLGGCHHERPERLPGETDVVVSSVTLRGAGGAELAVDHGELGMLLGLRRGSLLVTHRYFNEFRLAEDRRRIESWWQHRGYFDVEVAPPEVVENRAENSVAVRWTVREGPAYQVASVAVRHAPDDHAAALEALVPVAPGDSVELEKYRHARHEMAWHLQRAGFGHATVYSRAWVDRQKKVVHYMYFVDAGPATRVGAIRVEGAHKIPEELVLERAGVAPGDRYSLELKEAIELDLLDTGAYGSVVVKPLNAQIDRVLPGERPDPGGTLADQQVDAQGKLVPRELPEAIDFRLVVVEAPSRQLRVRAGLEADSTRGDVYGGATVWLRNLFGPQHHLVLEGRVGYGVLWTEEDRDDAAGGVYGEALARWVRPGLFARMWDGRLSARYRDLLYPGFRLRELSAGPGLHTRLGRAVFLDFDAWFRAEQDLGFGPFDPAVRDRHHLASETTSRGPKLESSLIWDARDDRVEPSRGHLLGLRAGWSPGGELGTHRFAELAPEGRLFVPLTESWSLALRSSFAFVLAEGNNGVPVGPRLFGGGAFGMRGFGRQRLSPEAPCATPAPGTTAKCDSELVGALGLMESSAELRFLPFRKTFGFASFLDAGAAGPRQDPFEEGTSLALGFGPRLRLWYLPIDLDFAYRLLRQNELESPKSWDPYLVFLRIGEAF